AYFLRTLPHGVEHLIVTADDLGQLDVALREDPPPDEHTRGGLGGRGGRGGRRAGWGSQRRDWCARYPAHPSAAPGGAPHPPPMCAHRSRARGLRAAYTAPHRG